MRACEASAHLAFAGAIAFAVPPAAGRSISRDKMVAATANKWLARSEIRKGEAANSNQLF